MIPLVGIKKELVDQEQQVRAVAEEVFAQHGIKVAYLVGTMIELPRAALTADKIAETAEFFSFGTNDLTQTTFGVSRDDAGKFLPLYLARDIWLAAARAQLASPRKLQQGTGDGLHTQGKTQKSYWAVRKGRPGALDTDRRGPWQQGELSCKVRGLCPSCASKRAAAVVACLREEVLAEVGHVQWVCPIPSMLRPYFLFHRRRSPLGAARPPNRRGR